MIHPKFGDFLVNTSASEDNPNKMGQFVEVKVRKGRLNRGTWYRLTNGSGRFWLSNPASLIPYSEYTPPS